MSHDDGRDDPMEITDKMEHVRDQVRQHRADEKLDHLQRENLRLETETRMLRQERDDEKGDLATLMGSLEPGSRHRIRRLITLTSVAAGAYVVGAKAGRERYDDIRAFAQKAMDTGRSAFGRARDRTDDAIESALVVSDRVSEAGQVIGETVKTVAEGRDDEAVGDATTSRTA